MLGARYCAILTVACSAGQLAPSSERPGTPGDANRLGSELADAGAPPPAAAPSVPAAAPVKPDASAGDTRPARSFPPKDIAPPHPRSAETDDGKWEPFPPGAPFSRTVIHPHEASRFIAVTILAIDLASVSVHFMPGTEDLGGQKVPFSAGLVPSAEHARLVGVFNGGFQPRHGHWGMKLGDSTIVSPRDPGCTLALFADGSVRLRSWPALAASAAEMRAFRQTPPCLVEEGAIHPDLLAGRDKAWAGHTPGIVTRRRSAVGLDEKGEILFYAVGVEASPRLLAEALRVAGARNAAELDINWNWTRFLAFEHGSEGTPRVAAALVPGEFSKTGYVSRPSERDFFYLLRK